MNLDNHLCSPGVWPVMLTPFHASGAVDFDGLDGLTDWYINSGVAGLFAVCLSSEMYQLSDRERVDIAARVVKRSAGRVAVVAAVQRSGPMGEWADAVRAIHDVGAAASVVIVNQFNREEFASDVERLVAGTGDAPLGLYECPVPEWTLLTTNELAIAANTGRFTFFKDTSCGATTIEPRLKALAGTPLRLFNADSVSLLTSLRMGAYGYSGIAANYFPELCVWLCANYDRQSDTAKQVQSFLGVSQLLADYKYPQNAKEFLALSGIPIGTTCRLGQYRLSDREHGMLRALLDQSQQWRSLLNLP